MIIEQLEYQIGAEDPAGLIMERVREDLAKIPAIFGSRVLIAIAPSAGKSKGGIIFTDKRKDEGRFQGKAGLVLKLGTEAFKYNPRYPSFDWEGPKAEVGDWVHFFNSDSREIGVGGICCRYIWDADILGTVSDPEAVY
jgi:co-chaperonin GroES (HSP10)